MNDRKTRRAKSAEVRPHVEPLEGRRLLAAATLTFEAAPLGPSPASGLIDPAGYTFTSLDGRNAVGGTEPILVYGPERGFASKVIQPFNYGRVLKLARTAGGNFNLISLDYGAAIWGDAGDLTVTGTFADGSTQTRAVAFSTRQPSTLNLSWTSLTGVALNFADGVNPVYGSLDNFVLNDGTGGGGGGTTSFGTGGRATVAVPGHNWVTVDESVPAPDGGAFLIGRYGDSAVTGFTVPAGGSAIDPTPASTTTFVTKLKADGTVDTGLFGGNVFTTPAALGWPGGRSITGLTAAPGGGYVGTFGSNQAHIQAGDTLVKLAPDFRLDSSFGGGDGIAQLSSFGPFALRGDGKVLFAGQPFGAGGYLELYNADGSLLNGSRRAISGYVGFDASVGDLTAGPGNSVFVSAGSTLDGQAAAAKLFKVDGSLVLSGGFGTNGVQTRSFAAGDIFFAGDVFVGRDGRALWTIQEDDGIRDLLALNAAGQTVAAVPNNALDTPAVPLLNNLRNAPRVLDVDFADDGTFTVAALYTTSAATSYLPARPYQAFSLSKFNANGSAAAGFGTGGVQSVFDVQRPVAVNDADALGGSFFVAGSDDASTFAAGTTAAVTAFRQGGTVRLLPTGSPVTGGGGDTGGGGTTTPATVDFETAPLGNTPSAGYLDPGGFRFVNANGSTLAGSDPLQVFGPNNGFPSRVIQPNNWGRAVVVSRPDGAAFDLTSFAYAASIYGDDGDFVVTGTFANGTTSTLGQAFTRSKSPATLTPNWTGLTRVTVNFAGGVNSAFGTLDNFVFGTGTNPPAPAGSGVVVEAEASTNSVAGTTSSWQTVAGGVGTSLQALPDVGQKLREFPEYSTSGPRRDYAVTLPAAGRYYLWARGRGVAGSLSSSNSLHFGLNGARVATAEAVTFPGETLDWTNARQGAPRAFIDVSAAGTYTLNLYMREDGVLIDRFLLTRDAAYVPAGNGPAAGVLA